MQNQKIKIYKISEHTHTHTHTHKMGTRSKWQPVSEEISFGSFQVQEVLTLEWFSCLQFL